MVTLISLINFIILKRNNCMYIVHLHTCTYREETTFTNFTFITFFTLLKHQTPVILIFSTLSLHPPVHPSYNIDPLFPTMALFFLCLFSVPVPIFIPLHPLFIPFSPHFILQNTSSSSLFSLSYSYLHSFRHLLFPPVVPFSYLSL